MNIVALIPARAGSKRIPGKNTRLLAGHPLIAYTIAAAVESGIFSQVVCSSDDWNTLDIAARYGANIFLRQPVGDDQPDIAWVRPTLVAAGSLTPNIDAFALLRPTSPFRTSGYIRQAWAYFQENQPSDSARAVREAREHPGKMWAGQRGQRIVPLLPYYTRTGNEATDAPWHSAPTQALPPFFVQTGSLEIAWTKTVTETDTIAGASVLPLRTEGYEGFDLNTERDWADAERLIATGEAVLPPIPVARVSPALTP